jgi:thioredoxin-related protein
MRYFIGILLLAGSFVFAGSVDTDNTVNVVKHASTIPYTGHPIFIMFDSSTCPYCKKTRKDLSSDPYLMDVAKGFDLYNIPRDEPQAYNILGNDTTLQTLQMVYKVKVTPNIVLLTSHGEKIWQLPGYVKPEVLGKIMNFVKGVDEGRYKKAEWKVYLKKNGLI